MPLYHPHSSCQRSCGAFVIENSFVPIFFRCIVHHVLGCERRIHRSIHKNDLFGSYNGKILVWFTVVFFWPMYFWMQFGSLFLSHSLSLSLSIVCSWLMHTQHRPTYVHQIHFLFPHEKNWYTQEKKTIWRDSYIISRVEHTKKRKIKKSPLIVRNEKKYRKILPVNKCVNVCTAREFPSKALATINTGTRQEATYVDSNCLAPRQQQQQLAAAAYRQR